MKRNDPVSGLEGATDTTENTTTSQVEDNTTEEKPTTDTETTSDDNTDDSGDVDSDPEPDSDETTDSETGTTDDDDGENYGPDDEEDTFETWSFDDIINDDEEDDDESEWDADTTDDADTEQPQVDKKTQKYIAKLRRENAAYRKRYQEFRETSMEEIEQQLADSYTTIAKAAHLEGEYNDQTLADAISKQIQEATNRADQAQKELAVYKAAQELDADAEQLMDSVKFTTQLKELNPTDADYQQKVKELVEHATSETNRKTHRISRQGSDMSAGKTEVDLDNMTFEQRREYRKANRSRSR